MGIKRAEPESVNPVNSGDSQELAVKTNPPASMFCLLRETVFHCWNFSFHGRILQEKLDQPVSAPPSPRDISMEIDSPENMMRHIRFLKNEVERLKKQLRAAQLQRT